MTATVTTTSSTTSPVSSSYAAPSGGSPLQGVKVVFSRVRGTVEKDLRHTQLLNVQLWELDGNDADYHRLLDEKQLDIDDSTLAAVDLLMTSVVSQDWLYGEWIPYDAGATNPEDTGWIELRMRDILLMRLSPHNTTHANSTGLDTICDCTTTGKTVVGLVFDGNSYTTATGSPSVLEAHAYGGQIVRGRTKTEPIVNAGYSDVVAATRARFDAGTLNIDQTLTACVADPSATAVLEAAQVLMCPYQFKVAGTPTGWPIPSPNAIRTYVFAVDGKNAAVVNPYERTFGDWLNVTGVTSPDPLSHCRLIAREPWRGRVVIARPDEAPNAVYFLKAGDPTDATWGTGAGAAFKLDASSTYGVPADSVTAVITLSDDLFLIGCATRKYYLKGDLTSGGSFKDFPGEGGIVGPKAVCKGGEGRVFYLSQGGLRAARFGGEIIEDKAIGDHRIDKILSRISTFSTNVEVTYEALTERVHIYLHPRQGEDTGISLVLDVNDNALWPLRFPSRTFGPTAACQIAGENPDDNRVLIGGEDGYIRRYKFLEAADTGNPIDAWVRFPVVTLAEGTQLVNVVEINAVGESGSGPVDWMLFVAASADEIESIDITTATPAASGTWFSDGAEFQQPVDPGVAGGAAQLCVRQNSGSATFALSQVSVTVEPWGERRI